MSCVLRVRCTNPHCEHETIVREFPPTLEEPGDVDKQECEECGEDLDWDKSEDSTLEDLRWENDSRV